MARITKADLRAEGSGRTAVLTVEVTLDWDRGDDDHRWEVVVRFIGADTGLRGGDDVIKVHAMPVSPDLGKRATMTVDNRDGAFDEDAGGDDEIVADCTLHVVQHDSKVVRTNKVRGNF